MLSNFLSGIPGAEAFSRPSSSNSRAGANDLTVLATARTRSLPAVSAARISVNRYLTHFLGGATPFRRAQQSLDYLTEPTSINFQNFNFNFFSSSGMTRLSFPDLAENDAKLRHNEFEVRHSQDALDERKSDFSRIVRGNLNLLIIT